MTLYPQLFQQVIMNLVDNSIDALKNKQFASGVPEIKIAGRLIQQFFELEIEDNGEGISHEILEKITRPFFTTKVSTEGTGLGLAIVNDIVDRHNGTLSIESVEGQYTRVKIRIPVSTDQDS